MECGICERDLRGGHSEACPRRCQIINDTGEQCDRGAQHKGPHELYDDDREDWTGRWPAREGEPVRAGELLEVRRG